MYIFLILLSAVFLGCYEVLKKISLKKSDVGEVLFFYCLSGFVFSLIFINFALGLSFVDIVLVLVKSTLIVISWWLVLKCMKKLDVAIVVAFSLINTILVVFGSFVIFKEVISWLHIFSLLFISVGIVLVGLLDRKQTKNSQEKNHYRYLLLLTLSSTITAISALLDKYMINNREMDSRGVLVWFLFFTSLIYGVIYLIKNKKIEWKKLKENYWMILTGLAIVLADITYYFSINMEGAQLSLISILRKCSVIVATILASIFLKEKNLLKKLGILFIMLIGVAIPIIFN